jgi:hypothetical protein
MTIDQWLVSKIEASTTLVTTQVFPNFIPDGKIPPAIVYQGIGFDRNIQERNEIITLTTFGASKSSVENINSNLYDLFDTSTAYIKETSSSLSIDSVTIVNNPGAVYDETNLKWQRTLDISVWYHK